MDKVLLTPTVGALGLVPVSRSHVYICILSNTVQNIRNYTFVYCILIKAILSIQCIKYFCSFTFCRSCRIGVSVLLLVGK